MGSRKVERCEFEEHGIRITRYGGEGSVYYLLKTYSCVYLFPFFFPSPVVFLLGNGVVVSSCVS